MTKQRFPLSLASLILILAALAAAQSNLIFSSSGQTLTIPGIPFQGKLIGRMAQRLPDSTALMQELRGQIARDSEGRVRIEEQHATEPVSTEVLDPMNRISLRWSSASTTVTRTIPLSRLPWHVIFSSQSLLESYEIEAEEREPAKVTTEDLGKKTINGLAGRGTRTTTVISTGKIVHDVWFSEDLKLAILDTFTDPEGIEQTIEIQEVTRTEPDPALFLPPQGYTIRQVAGPGQIGGGGIVGGVASPHKQ